MSNNWQLPTKAELNAIYNQIHLKGLGGFKDEGYWSSSEYDYRYAWYQSLGDGHTHPSLKEVIRLVRFIRSTPQLSAFKGLVFTFHGQTFEVSEKDEPIKVSWNEAMKKYKGVKDE